MRAQNDPAPLWLQTLLAAASLSLPLSAGAAEAKTECTASKIKEALAPRSPKFATNLDKVYSTRCTTLENMARRYGATQVVAGRKLEATADLDVAAATQQLKAARENPAFQAALAVDAQGITDEVLLALLEIAVLDDMDYANARDLQIFELRKKGVK